MIKTQATRRLLRNDTYKLPDSVRKALDEHNKYHPVKLDILFDSDETFSWQIYQISTKGVMSDDDFLEWQMSAPKRGTEITPGILQWLKKYDTSNGGLLDRNELKKNWLKEWKSAKEKHAKEKINRKEPYKYNRLKELTSVLKGKHTMMIPNVVGIKDGRPVYAVPKGVAAAARRQQKRLGQMV